MPVHAHFVRSMVLAGLCSASLITVAADPELPSTLPPDRSGATVAMAATAQDGSGEAAQASLALSAIDQIRAALGSHLGEPGYLPEADLNRDGVVNVLDALVALGVGRDAIKQGDAAGHPDAAMLSIIEVERADRSLALQLRFEGEGFDIAGFSTRLLLEPVFVGGDLENSSEWISATFSSFADVFEMAPIARHEDLTQVSISEDGLAALATALSENGLPVRIEPGRNNAVFELFIDLPPDASGQLILALDADSLIVDGAGASIPLQMDPYILYIDELAADINRDGVVNSRDMAELLSSFGLAGAGLAADLNGDGVVDARDLAHLLGSWGQRRHRLERIAAQIDDASQTDEIASIESNDVISDSAVEFVRGQPVAAGGGPRIVSISPSPQETIRRQNDLAEIRITFDRPVVAPADSVRVWSIEGGVFEGAGVIPGASDSEIVVQGPLIAQGDLVTVVIDYSIVDEDGRAMDGEILDPRNPTFPSGDGRQGGQAVFVYKALVGDANGDGVVNSGDLALILGSWGQMDTPYDLSGNGIIGSADLSIVLGTWGQASPEPTGAAPVVEERLPEAGVSIRALSQELVEVEFTEEVAGFSMWERSLHALTPQGGLRTPESLELAPDGRSVVFTFDPPLDESGAHSLRLSRALSTPGYRLIDAAAAPLNWTFTLDSAPSRIVSTSPADGEVGVALTRETILTFSHPLEPGALTSGAFSAMFGGAALGKRLHMSPDRRRVTMFYDESLPSSARVRVTVNGGALQDDLGLAVDADQTGAPGGVGRVDFDTLSVTVSPGTKVVGRVFASEIGGDGETTLDVPLAGVRITVDGMEDELFADTDAMGNFTLDPAPAGRFFVHVDGRTVMSKDIPEGSYYPFVGKTFMSLAGQETNPMGEPLTSPGAMSRGNIFLPLVLPGTLQPVSMVEDTPVGFSAATIAQFSDSPEFRQILAGVQVIVPADSLFSDDGSRGGMVGIAPVPPDRIPGPLPEDLNLPIVITVQTDGPTNFDTPVRVRFPNLPDPVTGEPLEPGARSALWSFDHDLGDWVLNGPMTVTADGLYVESDEGFGIAAPGWHGTAPGFEVAGDYLFGGEPRGRELSDKKPLKSKLTTTQRNRLSAMATAPFDFEDAEKIFATIRDCGSGGSLCGPLIESTSPVQSMGADMRSITSDVADEYQAIGSSGSGLNGFIDVQCGEISPQLASRRDAFLVGFNAFGAEAELQAPLWAALDDALTEINALIDSGDIDAPYFGLSKTDLKTLTGLLDFVTNVLAELGARPNFGELYWDMVTDLFDLIVFIYNQCGGAVPFNSAVYWSVQPGDGGDYIRGRGLGNLSGGTWTVRLRPLSWASVRVFDPISMSYGHVFVQLGSFGEPRRLVQGYTWNLENELDSDGDGLPDIVEERVIGTDPFNPDTNGDGISDYAHVLQGTDPLAGTFISTGIIATAPTTGVAVDIAAFGDIAVVAESNRGVSVFNVFSGFNPVRIAQVDTPGAASAVAFNGSLVAVACGAEGLVVVDISDPPAAQIVHQFGPALVGGHVNAVATAGNIVVTGSNLGVVTLVDMASGLLLDFAVLPQGVEDVAVMGDAVYALTPQTLYALRLTPNSLELHGSAPSPWIVGVRSARFRLAAGDGVAYATNNRGYNTFDLSDPLQPTLAATGDTAQLGWRQTAPNGSGLGVAALSPNVGLANDGSHNISLYNLENPLSQIPSVEDRFLTEFTTPGVARAVAIYNGLAYVADSSSGLQVINYREFDAMGVAPQIEFTVSPLAPLLSADFNEDRVISTEDLAIMLSFMSTQDLRADLNRDSVVDGEDLRLFVAWMTLGDPTDNSLLRDDLLFQEGEIIFVTTSSSDDVQVRNVELLLDGQVVQTNGGFPFEFFLNAPGYPSDGDGETPADFEITVRATDTGGNRTTAEPIKLQVLPDLNPPQIVRADPSQDETVPNRLFEARGVTVRFNESIETSTINSDSVRVIWAGTDGEFETGDDTMVPVTLTMSVQNRVLSVAVDAAPVGLLRLTLDGDIITDLSGNLLDGDGDLAAGGDFVLEFEVIDSPYNKFWVTPFGGNWHDPANWSDDAVPTLGDLVLIDTPESIGTVTISQGAQFAGELVSRNPLLITGGSLSVAGDLTAEATITLNGGGIHAGVINMTEGAVFQVFTGNNILSGVTLNGDLTLNQTTSNLLLANNTLINGDILLSGPDARLSVDSTGLNLIGPDPVITLAAQSARIRFFGSHVFDNATMIFTGGGGPRFIHTESSGTLTIGENALVRGGNGQFVAGFSGGAPTLINNGQIVADVNGQTITVTSQAASFTNNNVMRAENGGTISVMSPAWVNDGEILSTGSTLTLTGAWSNPGQITADGGIVNLGGQFTTAGVGMFTNNSAQVNITGVMDNTDSTLTFNGGTGSWRLSQGTIVGGVVNQTGGATLQVLPGNNILSGVTLNGDLTLNQTTSNLLLANNTLINGDILLSGPDARLSVDSTGLNLIGPDPVITLAAQSARIRFIGSHVFDNATMIFTGGGGPRFIHTESSGTLTIGENALVRGGNGQFVAGFSGGAPTLINNGQIVADVNGQTITVTNQVVNFTNNSVMRAEGGGSLVVSAASWQNTGLLDVRAGGLFSAGAFAQTSAGATMVELAGTAANQHGRLIVSGAANLAGELAIELAGTFTPMESDLFDILTYGSRNGEFKTLTGLEIGDGLMLDPMYLTDRLRLQVVPAAEPAMEAAMAR